MMYQLVLAVLWLSIFVHAGPGPGRYSVTCNATTNTTLSNWFAPISGLVSEFLHSGCDDVEAASERYPAYIATWPQYGNASDLSPNSTTTTYAHIQGFAWADPGCATYDARRQVLQDLLGLFGYQLSPSFPYPMPEEFTSFGVAGAEIQVQLDASEWFMETVTSHANQFGSFNMAVHGTKSPNHGAISRAPWTDSSIQLELTGCGASLQSQPTNATIRYYSPRGLTVVSDVDDILRVAEVWNPKQMILNTFARPFRPWLNISEVYKDWRRVVPSIHFHWLTDTPVLGYKFYHEGLAKHFPESTYDFRPMNHSTFNQLLHPRYHNLRRLLETFPERNFVLIGDSTPVTGVKAYIDIAKEYPEQVQCIMIRDTSMTEPANWIVPNFKALHELQDRFYIFRTPADLSNTTTLMKQLHRGESVGCGGLYVDAEEHSYSSVDSLLVTV